MQFAGESMHPSVNQICSSFLSLRLFTSTLYIHMNIKKNVEDNINVGLLIKLPKRKLFPLRSHIQEIEQYPVYFIRFIDSPQLYVTPFFLEGHDSFNTVGVCVFSLFQLSFSALFFLSF